MCKRISYAPNTKPQRGGGGGGGQRSRSTGYENICGIATNQTRVQSVSAAIEELIPEAACAGVVCTRSVVCVCQVLPLASHTPLWTRK